MAAFLAESLSWPGNFVKIIINLRYLVHKADKIAGYNSRVTQAKKTRHVVGGGLRKVAGYTVIRNF